MFFLGMIFVGAFHLIFEIYNQKCFQSITASIFAYFRTSVKFHFLSDKNAHRFWCVLFHLFYDYTIFTYGFIGSIYPFSNIFNKRMVCFHRISRSLILNSCLIHMSVFTRGQYWPSGIVVACVCLCVCVSVRVSITSLSAR